MKGNIVIRLAGVDELTALVETMKCAVARIETLATARPVVTNSTLDGWLDAEDARKYLGDLSKSTFDKYRYQTTPSLKGCKLGGKILYKRSELDNFVRLYEVKSNGLA